MKKSTIIPVFAAIAFTVMAFFNNVYAWPLVFPLTGGILSIVINRKQSIPSGYGSIMKKGLIATLLVVLMEAPFLYFFAREAMIQKANAAGLGAASDPFLTIAGITVMSVALIFLVTYIIGTGLGALISKRNS